MLRDTSAALERMPQLLAKFRKMLPPRAHSTLPALERSVRKNLNPREAYNMVPSRDPQNG